MIICKKNKKNIELGMFLSNKLKCKDLYGCVATIELNY